MKNKFGRIGNIFQKNEEKRDKEDKTIKKPSKLLKVEIGIIVFLLVILILGISAGNSSKKDDTYHTIKITTGVIDEIRELKEKIRFLKYSDDELFDSVYSAKKNDEGKFNVEMRRVYSGVTMYSCALAADKLFVEIDKSIDNINELKFSCYTDELTQIGSIVSTDVSNYSEHLNDFHILDSNGNNTGKTLDDLKREEEERKVQEIKNYKDSCQKLNYKDVLRDPDKYYGQRAYWFGEVTQVVDSISYMIYVDCKKYQYYDGYSCNNPIYVVYISSESSQRLIEHDMVKIYGYMAGNQSYTTVMGANKTIPKVNALYADIQ